MSAHSFDCDCQTCNATDTHAMGMAIFRKTPAKVEPLVATNVKVIEHSEPVRRLPAGQKVGRGRVRTISTRQENFILKLIGERDLTDLKLVTGQSIDPNEIKYMGVKGASALIEKLLGLPYKGTNTPVKTVAVTNGIPATGAQTSYIKSLAERKGFTLTESLSSMTKQSASRMIETLLSMNDKPRQVISAKSNAQVTEGMYKTSEGKIFKVYLNTEKSRLLAKELIDGKFVYQGMATRFVKASERMSIEEAKAYGKRTGQCCVCSRTLTVKESIEAGIGPICASRF